jgi:ankyrin repeat protein
MYFIFQSALFLVSLLLTLTGCTMFFEKPGTPLADAAHRGDVAAMRALVAAGADANEYDAGGRTALHWAARGGHQLGPHQCREDTSRAEAVEALIDLGADPNAVDRRGSIPGRSSGWTPLHVAMHHEQFATADRLLERGANPNIRSRQGKSVMALAADEGAPRELVTKLLAKGFDPRLASVPKRP